MIINRLKISRILFINNNLLIKILEKSIKILFRNRIRTFVFIASSQIFRKILYNKK